MKPPELNHPEVYAFYEYDLNIPREKVEAILALPRPSLVEDLRALLRDAVDRYDYFAEQDEWNEDEMEFPMHALWLLADLKEPGTFDDVMELLRADKKVHDFWFVDTLTEDLWEVVYHLGKDSLEDLLAFALDREADLYARTVASATAEQIAAHHPERREEVAAWYQAIFTQHLEWSEKGELTWEDRDLVSFAVTETVSTGSEALLPLLKELYEKGIVNEGIAGPYGDLEKEIRSTPPEKRRRKIFDNIFERYEYAVSNWHYYREKYDEAYREEQERQKEDRLSHLSDASLPDYSYPRTETVKREGKKVGRNDPCPCGSGKKYKKCCWGK